MNMESGINGVFKRRVFYVPGYDPFPSRRYRELYRTEGRRQAEISGYRIDMKPGDRPTDWRVRTEIGEDVAVARIDVLPWSDIVRRSMTGNIFRSYARLAGTAITYLSTGTLRRLSWIAKGPVLAALYPIVALLLQLALALLLGVWLGGLVVGGVEWMAASLGLGSGLGVVALLLRWGIALPVAWRILRWFRDNDRLFFAYYLMNDYAYTASCGGAYPAELEDRLDSFRARIASALKTEVDEVLVVGHSSGAQLAVSVVSDLLAEGQVPEDGPELSLLTLGQVIPMVSFLPKAHRLRRDLNRLAGSDEIAWVDISAPGDGCCFALSDPVAVSGVSPPEQRWPMVISAAFRETLSPEAFQALRHRYFRLHFQYLCAFERPRDYDYFAITGGAQTLRDRFRQRRSSKARIDVAASRFSSMVA